MNQHGLPGVAKRNYLNTYLYLYDNTTDTIAYFYIAD
jgi:hypothetical protein